MQFKEPLSRIRENSPLIIVNLWNFFVLYMNGLSPVLSIAGPEIIQPKRDTDYEQNVKSKQIKANNVNHGKGKLQEKLGLPPKKRYV